MTALADNAIEILRENDRGSYTVPTHGLYPFQWNWDSCLTALGQRRFGEERASWSRLAQAMTAEQWDEFSGIAERKGLRAVCLDGIERARACFQTAIPERVLAALARPGPARA